MTEKEINGIVKTIANEISVNGNISLEKANMLIDAVKQKASEMGLAVVVAVSNAGGNPVAVQCMDNAYIASYDIAFNKAYTVVSLKMSTKQLSGLSKPGDPLYGIQFTNNGRIVIFGGGVPLYDKFGRIIGGLGVSGGSEEQDTFLADFGGQYYNEHLQ